MFSAFVTTALLATAGVSDALRSEKEYRSELVIQDPLLVGGKFNVYILFLK